MRQRYLFGCVVALLTSLTLVTPAATIEVLETFDYPGTANLTFTQKINDHGVIVGYLRDSDDTLTFPIDAGGVTHGLFFIALDDPLTFDFPESAFISLNGINRDGFIYGRYVDAAGIAYGFLAKVNPNASDANPQTNNLVPSPLQPRVQSPLRIGVPLF